MTRTITIIIITIIFIITIITIRDEGFNLKQLYNSSFLSWFYLSFLSAFFVFLELCYYLNLLGSHQSSHVKSCEWLSQVSESLAHTTSREFGGTRHVCWCAVVCLWRDWAWTKQGTRLFNYAKWIAKQFQRWDFGSSDQKIYLNL